MDLPMIETSGASEYWRVGEAMIEWCGASSNSFFRQGRSRMDSELLKQGRETVAKGLDWLYRHNDQISQIEDLSAHYKAPYLYAVLGDSIRARYYADLMRTRYLQADGDFRTNPMNRGWADAPVMPAVRYLYPSGWIIVGLRKLGVYDAASRGVDFVRRFQSPELGGFFSSFDVSSGQVETGHLDTSSTSSAGLALLACGFVEEAARAGDFMLKLGRIGDGCLGR
jgi:hypothetical protein